MNDRSKKHHFNPQHILKNFVLDGQQALYVLDKQRPAVFQSTPRDAGHENQFNEVTVGNERINLEFVFEDADSRQGVLVDKIIQCHGIKSLNTEERVELAQLVVLQLLRVKIVRINIQELPKQLRAAFRELGVDQTVAPDIDANQAKLSSFGMLKDCSKLAPLVFEKQWSVVNAPKESWFWTSDNPICIANHFDSGERYLGSQGSVISWPISKEWTLQFACPSVSNKIEVANKDAANYLRSEPTMMCLPEHVDIYNRNQMKNATRFVYAPTSDFEAAMELLNRHPSVKSAGGVVKLEKTFNHAESLDGKLVIYGKSTIHEIPFESWAANPHVTVRVSEHLAEELGRAISDAPHSEIRIIDFKGKSQGMREVELVQKDRRTVTIQHSNRTLQAIMDATGH